MRLRVERRWGACVLAGMLACGCVPLAAASHEAGSHVSGPQHGAIRGGGPPGYLGIDVRDVGDDQVTTLKLKDTRGAEIIRVDHDGPAGKMGLREHDVILQMNGTSIEGEEQLRRLLHDCAPGRVVSLTIGRDGTTLTVAAPMADRAQLEHEAWEQHLGAAMGAGMPGPQAPPNALPSGDAGAMGSAAAGPAPTSRYSKSFLGSLLTSPTYTGAMLEAMMPQLAQYFGIAGGTGLLVRSVADGSPAALSGMRAGDVVLRANGRQLRTPGDWLKVVHEAKGRPVQVMLLRDKQERTLTVTPDVKHKSSLELPFAPGLAERISGLSPI